MKKHEIYTKRKVGVYGILELIFIIAYAISVSDIDLVSKGEMAKFLAFLGTLFFPILILICGRMCIEGCFYLKLYAENKWDDKKNFYVSLAVAGISTVLYFCAFINLDGGGIEGILSYFLVIFMMLNWYECLKKLFRR